MFEFEKIRIYHYMAWKNRGLFLQKIEVFFLKKIEVFFFANRPLQGFNPLTKVYWKIRVVGSVGDVSRVLLACVLHALGTNPAAVRGFRNRFPKPNFEMMSARFQVPFKNQGLIIAPILEISRTKNPIRRFSPILTVIFHRLQIGTPGFLQCTGEDAPFKVKQVPFLVPHGFLFQKTKPSCFQNSFRSVWTSHVAV